MGQHTTKMTLWWEQVIQCYEGALKLDVHLYVLAQKFEFRYDILTQAS